MQVQITLPKGAKVRDLHRMADAIDCRVKFGPNGSFSFAPRATGNANVVKIPRYQRQNLKFREHE